MWWQDVFWGLWNGITAWIVLIVHVFGGWGDMKIFDSTRSANGNWYDFGFLLGTGSPLLGFLRRK